MNLKFSIQHLKKSEFLRNASTLITGTTVAQLIPILIQPILRRYYSVEVFGTYAVYLSLIGILYAISSMRYEQAIINPEDEEEAKALLWTAQFFNLLFSLLLLLAILLFKPFILEFLNIKQEHAIYLLMAPAGILLFNLQQSLSLWLIRNKAFAEVSKVKIVRRSSEGLFQLGFRFLAVPKGLILGDILGHISNIIFALFRCVRRGFNLKAIQWDTMKTVIIRYSEYPKYNALTTFLNAFSLMAPVIIINKYYGSENAGYYDLAKLLLLTPAALIAGGLSNVMLQRVAERRKNAQLFLKEIYFILCFGVALSIVEITVLHFFGEQIFSILFGTEWAFSGKISKVLMWPYLGFFFTISLSSTFIAMKKIKLLSLFQVVNFILVWVLFVFKYLEFSSFIKVFALLSISGTIIFFILLFTALKRYNYSLKSVNP